MAIQKFRLKSGTELQVDVASFEVAIGIVEAIKKAMITTSADKDAEIGDAVASDPSVRRAVVEAFRWVLYGSDVMSVDLLNDPKKGEKVRGDYFEIMRRVIEVNSGPFFQQASFGLTPPEGGTTGDRPSRLLHQTA